MIRLGIKPNYAALGREYGCDYRTAKKKYEIEKQIEQGINIELTSRNHIIDSYKEIIDNKLETIPGKAIKNHIVQLEMRLHYSKKFYARLTIDKKRDEVKTCIIESLEYFNGCPREI